MPVARYDDDDDVYIYIYIYIFCVCVCVNIRGVFWKQIFLFICR